MTGWEGESGCGERLREAMLWSGAAVVVLAVHAGVATWFMRESAMTAPPPASTAIAVELAPMPMAEEVQDETALPPDQPMIEAIGDTPEDDPAKEAEDTSPVEPDLKEKQPDGGPDEAKPQEVGEPAEEKVDEEAPVMPDDVAVPIPVPRPEPPVRQARHEPPRQEQAAPSPRSAAPPRIKAERAPRAAAPQPAPGKPAPQISPAQWQLRLLAHLERHKRYPSRPRSRREEGTVQLRFTIDEVGNVTAAVIASSSGHPDLDQAVLDMIRRASPVPAPPEGVNRRLTVPVRFSLR